MLVNKRATVWNNKNKELGIILDVVVYVNHSSHCILGWTAKNIAIRWRLDRLQCVWINLPFDSD